MIIVSTDRLKEGMQLYANVDSSTGRDYGTLVPKGTILTAELIALLRAKGIKSVKIVGGDETGTKVVKNATPEELRQKQRISCALTDLDEIFDCNEEIKELSHSAVQKVDRIAGDIIGDIAKDASFLGNQMIALQNYDDYTYKHCLRVAMMAASVCGELGLTPEETKETVIAGLLHDIGKSNIDHEIIIKPGKLTNEEFDEIKKHPLIGYNILKQSGEYSDNVLSGVLFHQEKFDGSGYPTGLVGEKIPRIARVLTICDVFDALTSNRPYRTPWSVAETEEYIFGSCGTHFDYMITLAFLRAFNPYPIGTLVRLSDGRYGAVSAHNENVLRPTVTTMGEDGGEILDLTNNFDLLTISVEGLYTGEIESA
ncbi:MAG: HD-GYP domain-containing protein [Bacteroides sp.]|nr:HD-GYP domain-containing protein [Eubacterium sp.]MCM1419077.1 HD-GYP domain-containing protein [Roseburia sp.]MCM1462939.1 HD-GYP domain-containing protein [Bacteroides sp.]